MKSIAPLDLLTYLVFSLAVACGGGSSTHGVEDLGPAGPGDEAPVPDVSVGEAPDGDGTAPACEDECTVVGTKKCSGNRVQVCLDHDSDGCLEWGGDQDCGALSCSNGFCAATCEDECTVVGARACDGPAAYKVCGVHDADDCLEWDEPVACAGEETCSNGYCKAGCENECTLVGARACNDSNTGYRVCGDTDQDPCLEWGSDAMCAEGLVCSNGYCASTCEDECAASGTRACDDAKTGFKVCSDKNQDGCLEWGSVTPCAEGETCSNGMCALSCKDECTTPEARQCDAAGSGFRVCDDANEDGCLEWGSILPCEENETCSGGYCSLACKSECTVAGARACNGSSTGYRVCEDKNGDGCLEWSGDIACGEGQVCSNGTCGVTCKDECTAKGARSCDGALGYKVCDDHAAGGCLTWGSTVPCGEHETCAEGFCNVGCQDDCDTAGLDACNDSHTAVRTCGDYNDDGCLEWGSDQACDQGQTCANGKCTITCEDECETKGLSACNEGLSGFRVCDDYNGDGCLELGTLVPCGAAATCVGGACEPRPMPAGVLISEVLYDPAGVDTTAFVELWGPAGTDLMGFVLAGIDGATGSEYNVIQLSGIIPADGFFVVSQSEAAYADMVTSKANFQNGPDSIVLRWGEEVVDAIGYGDFSGGTAVNFAGETAAAVDAEDGRCLARDEDMEDTGNNAADFRESSPTPGTANTGGTPPDHPPVAAFTVTPMENATVLVDASASSDAETPASNLEVRWDFQNDGTWETAFSTAKQESFTYPGPGTYTIKLEVRDASGQTAIAVQAVNLAGTKNVQGEVTTTTWSGVVNVVGHVTVPSGETLTVDAGTVVNVKGLFKIEIKGKIQVKGESGAPVLFTSPDKTPGAWQGLTVGWTYDNYIKFAIFEYADIGLKYGAKSGTLTDCTFRFNQTAGLSLYQLYEGSNVILERLTATRNEGVGIDIQGGKYFDLKYATCTDNGGHGLKASYIDYDPPKVTNATLTRNGGAGFYGTRVIVTLDHCDITENEFGIEFYSYSLTVTNSRITANRREGIWVNDQVGEANGEYKGMNLAGNDIYGNSTASGSVLVTLDQQVSTQDPAGFTGTKFTDPLASKNGEDILYAWYEYSEQDAYSGNNIVGSLTRNDSDTEVAYAVPGGQSSRWVELANTAGLTSIRGKVEDKNAYQYGSLTLHSILYFVPASSLAQPVEMTVMASKGVAVNGNWWGVTTVEDFHERVLDCMKTVTDTPSLASGPIPGAGVQPQ